jgi:uncharacterized membrane protein YgdD (TMEM256/DUF423 family)
MIKLFLMTGSLFCMLSVVLGAFAAHGLKSRVSEYAIGVFKTAAEPHIGWLVYYCWYFVV